MSTSSLCAILPRVLNHEPTYGQPERFSELKKQAVAELAQMLTDMRSHLANGAQNYRDLIDKACKLRQDIAKKTKTPDAEQFGLRRARFNQITHLYSLANQGMNRQIKDLILKCIPEIKNKNKGIRKTEGCSRYTFRLTREEKDLSKQLEQMIKLSKCLEQRASSSSDANNTVDETIFVSMMSQEHQEKIVPLLSSIQNRQPHDDFYIYSGRIEIEVNGVWRTLTRHFAVIECNEAGEIEAKNIRDFSSHFFASLLHTNHEDFPYHEAPMAQLLNRILDVNTTPAQLPALIREFEYRLHHLCYAERGSAATNEMILEAIRDVVCPSYTLKGNREALPEPFLSSYLRN